MTDLTFVPAELAELSVAQLAALSPQQKILLGQQLEQAGDWLNRERIWYCRRLKTDPLCRFKTDPG